LRQPDRELHAARRHGARIRGGIRVQWIALANRAPALTNEDNYEQLRASLRAARERYLAGGSRSAWGGQIHPKYMALGSRLTLPSHLRAQIG